MAKITPFDVFKKRTQEQLSPDISPRASLIRNIIEKLKDFIDLCRLQSDEYIRDDYDQIFITERHVQNGQSNES